MKNNKIYLVEDDSSIGNLIEAVFAGNGSQVQWFKSGTEATQNFKPNTYDICILDYSLPDMDGITLARQIRSSDQSVPILFVTANDNVQTKYTAFEAGCDDYIQKPFQIRELVLRVDAILRRTQSFSSERNNSPGFPSSISFDYNIRVLNGLNGTVKLSAKEAHLIKLLFDNFNSTVTRKDLMEKVWGSNDLYTSKCLDVYLSKLRKIIKTNTPLEILNEHGVGYKVINGRS